MSREPIHVDSTKRELRAEFPRRVHRTGPPRAARSSAAPRASGPGTLCAAVGRTATSLPRTLSAHRRAGAVLRARPSKPRLLSASVADHWTVYHYNRPRAQCSRGALAPLLLSAVTSAPLAGHVRLTCCQLMTPLTSRALDEGFTVRR